MRERILSRLYNAGVSHWFRRQCSTTSYRQLTLFDDIPVEVDRRNTPFRFPRIMTALMLANVTANRDKYKIDVEELYRGVKLAYRTVTKSLSKNDVQSLAPMIERNLLTKIALRLSSLSEVERQSLYIEEPDNSKNFCVYLAERGTDSGDFLDIFTVFFEKSINDSIEPNTIKSQVIGNIIMTRKSYPEKEDEEDWLVHRLNYHVMIQN